MSEIGAVAACTRALANSSLSDLPMFADGASNLAVLRAMGDRAAVRRQFHDPEMHGVERPRESSAAAIFDELEQARLEVLGLGWLPGVAVNLLREPGPPSSAVRWVAFQIFSGRDAPAAMTTEVDQLKRALSPRMMDDLLALLPLLRDQPRFGSASAAFAGGAAAAGWGIVSSSIEGEDTDPEAPPNRQPSIFNEVAGAAEGPIVAQSSRGDAAFPGWSASETGPGAGYCVFSTAHDRVVDAAVLAGPGELAQLRLRLDRELGETRLAVTRLANRLRRLLMASQVREWRFDQDEGRVDGRRLAALVAGSAEVRPFKREGDAPFPSTAVTLLIDHSGSMRGRSIMIAALTVEILVPALERCSVQCEVLGFTTREWDGGRPAREWAVAGSPPGPGRLNATEHIIIKAAEVPWRRARTALGLALRDDVLKENIDGEAVAWAHSRLRSRPERRRLLLVVSDGAPKDETTERSNDAGYLSRHLRAVVDEIESHSPIRIAAIGIGHDVSRFYSQATTIMRAEDLATALGGFLAAFLAPAPKPVSAGKKSCANPFRLFA